MNLDSHDQAVADLESVLLAHQQSIRAIRQDQATVYSIINQFMLSIAKQYQWTGSAQLVGQ
jgi:hypothetical protein